MGNSNILFYEKGHDKKSVITPGLDRDAIVCPVLAKMSAFEPLGSMIDPKYLKLSILLVARYLFLFLMRNYLQNFPLFVFS